MDAEQRALEMMMIKMNKLPPIAYAYAKYLCNIYGGCGEVLMTAWAHYAQAIEGLSCENDLYLIGLEGTRWFEENKEKFK